VSLISMRIEINGMGCLCSRKQPTDSAGSVVREAILVRPGSWQ
jgi:hypothetical protein